MKQLLTIASVYAFALVFSVLLLAFCNIKQKAPAHTKGSKYIINYAPVKRYHQRQVVNKDQIFPIKRFKKSDTTKSLFPKRRWHIKKDQSLQRQQYLYC